MLGIELVHKYGWFSLVSFLSISPLASCGAIIDLPLFSSTAILARPDNEYLWPTGMRTDLAIAGRGWFVLRDHWNGRFYYTRAGDFRIDYQGALVTNDGLFLQGYSDGDLTQIGDLKAVVPNITYQGVFEIESDGTVLANISDNGRIVAGQILLQDFGEPQNLVRVAYHRYVSTEAARPVSSLNPPGSFGLGTVEVGKLDMTPEIPRVALVSSEALNEPLEPGLPYRTGIATELRINGTGAFLLRDPKSGELFLTRCGLFLRDGADYLTTYDGLRLQGVTSLLSTNIGDIRTRSTPYLDPINSDEVISSFHVSRDGTASISYFDSSSVNCGQVVLFTTNEFARAKAGLLGRLGPVVATDLQKVQVTDGLPGDGIHQGTLELDHVPDELASMRANLHFFVQQSLFYTGNPLDLALSGPGFFLLRDPIGNALFVSRIGSFRLDSDGYVVTSTGLRLQGFVDSEQRRRGDLRLNGDGRPDYSDEKATVIDFAVNETGHISVLLSDGTAFVRGQVLLQDFREQYRLKSVDDRVYTNIEAAQPRFGDGMSPAIRGLGRIESGTLESNDPDPMLPVPQRHGLRLRIDGDTGAFFSIQMSTNLVDWTEIRSLRGQGSPCEVPVPNTGTPVMRIFRVIQSKLFNF